MKQPLGRWTTLVLLACAACAACMRDAGQGPAGVAAPPMPVQAGDVASVAGAAAQGPEAGQETAVVLSAALVRRQPTEARLVPSPGKKGRQSNVLATLYRGEAVVVRARRVHFVDVTLSDESHGWVKEDGILTGPCLRLATVLGPSRLFTRPDLLALQGSRTVAAGTLLIVLRHKDQFSLVNYAGGQSAWVLTALLQSEADEVGAAKLVHRARLLQEREDSGAEAVLELLRGQFGRTRLFAALEAGQVRAEAAAAALGADAHNGSSDGQAPPVQLDAAPAAAAAAPTAPSLRLTPAPAAPAPAATGGAPGLQGWQPPMPAPPEQPEPDSGSSGADDAALAPEDDGVF